MKLDSSYLWFWASVIAGALFVFAALAIAGSFLVGKQRDDFTRRFGRQLRELFIAVDPARLWALQWAFSGVVAALAVAFTDSLLAGLVAAITAAAVPWVLVRQVQQRQLNKLRHQIPDVLMLMSGSLRSGSGLSVSIARAAQASPSPIRQHLEWLLSDLRLGTTLTDALAAFERRINAEEVMLMATALRVGADTGGPLARTLESLADVIRRRLAIESRIRALTAQGRLQAWIMAVLPFGVFALLAAVDPPSFNELAFTRGGQTVLGLVCIAQIIGFRLVRRIVSIEV